eukprot:CAMPEP_0179269988 /NCGR_PEP_ID=MMETSP0797-20121207/31239_1 /TAXON_ID=47934 /ORGANISM="Dinophysis acuminata, Strain DAEP01" /LENGTH=189 /DNA_ID=CAMNT_0020978317 /DNA_START=107 /DNA_END=676 /DNA_ORIENTATION=-
MGAARAPGARGACASAAAAAGHGHGRRLVHSFRGRVASASEAAAAGHGRGRRLLHSVGERGVACHDDLDAPGMVVQRAPERPADVVGVVPEHPAAHVRDDEDLGAGLRRAAQHGPELPLDQPHVVRVAVGVDGAVPHEGVPVRHRHAQDGVQRHRLVQELVALGGAPPEDLHARGQQRTILRDVHGTAA